MKTSILAFCSIAAVAALSTSAFADDKWEDSQSFERSDASFIRVIGPDGYALGITVDGQVRNDTVPAKINVAPDNYYNVTVTAPSGAKWTKKVEAKRYTTTVVVLKHTPDAPQAKTAAAAPAVRQYIGSVRNQLKTCGKAYTAKLEFVDAAGGAGPTIQVDSGKMNQAQLPAGTWDARAYIWESDQWTYQTTQKVNIAADNWKAGLGCPNNGPFAITFQ
ncbi:MAG TPA: hypothetical protein VGM90_05915 [Kofleriaceae bacterium]